MKISYHDTFSGELRLDPQVDMYVGGIRVIVGDYACGDYQGSSDEAHEVGLPDVPAYYTCYLAVEESTGEVIFFVDEVIRDGTDAPFTWAGSGYKKLELVCWFSADAGTTPDTLTVNVKRNLPFPTIEEPELPEDVDAQGRDEEPGPEA